MRNRIQIVSLLLLITLIVLIFAPMLHHSIFERIADYPNHIRRGKTLFETGYIEIPHMLFAISVMLTHRVTNLPWGHAGFLVALTAYIALGIVLYTLFVRPLFGPRIHYGASLAAITVTLMLMTISAINFFTLPDQNLYFGYILPNVYHSPTMTLMRPFAVAAFFFAITTYTEAPRFKKPALLALAAVLTALGCLAKPVYLMALLPALGLVTLYRILKHQYINWQLLILGIVVPAGIVLTFQIFYLPNADGGQFGFMPLGFYQAVDETVGTLKGYSSVDSLPFTLLLSLVFPISVYLGYFKAARNNFGLNLSWLTLFFGALYLLLLVEVDRVVHGNFGWSAQVSIFMLFVTSTVFFVSQIYAPETGFRLNRTAWICAFVLALHIAGGVLWYAGEISSPNLTWW